MEQNALNHPDPRLEMAQPRSRETSISRPPEGGCRFHSEVADMDPTGLWVKVELKQDHLLSQGLGEIPGLRVGGVHVPMWKNQVILY